MNYEIINVEKLIEKLGCFKIFNGYYCVVEEEFGKKYFKKVKGIIVFGIMKGIRNGLII